MYEFTGMAELFTPIATRHSLIRDRLLEIARDSHVPQARRDPHIAVHVRMGDFSFPRDSRDLDFRNGRVNFRLPIEWYVHTLGLLRKSFGSNMRAKVFSDGSAAELAPLLRLENIELVGRQSALKDLLELSQAPLLIASGSTFSMWASYLGRMPVVWHPGQLRQRLYAEDPQLEVEVGQDADLGPEFRSRADQYLT